MPAIIKNGQIYAYSDALPVTTNLDETNTHNQVPSAKAVYDKLANFDVDVDLSDLYSKTEVDTLLDNKSDINHTHNYVELSSIVTELDGTSTDETIPSSKAVYDLFLDSKKYNFSKTTLWEGTLNLGNANITIDLSYSIHNYDVICVYASFTNGNERKTNNYIESDNITHNSLEDFTISADRIGTNYIDNYGIIVFPTNKTIKTKMGSSNVIITKVVGIKSVEKVYSTEEKVIGTWIDGKPIYRKMWVDIPLAITNSEVLVADLTELNIDRVINLTGNAINNANSEIPINFYVNSSNYIYSYVDNKASIKSRVFGLQGIMVSPILEYTKTTD